MRVRRAKQAPGQAGMSDLLAERAGVGHLG